MLKSLSPKERAGSFLLVLAIIVVALLPAFIPSSVQAAYRAGWSVALTLMVSTTFFYIPLSIGFNLQLIAKAWATPSREFIGRISGVMLAALATYYYLEWLIFYVSKVAA